MNTNESGQITRRDFIKSSGVGATAVGGASQSLSPEKGTSDKKRMVYDVVVAGGGPAGIGAAVAAARNGAKTLLVEGTNCLGGMMTNGLVPMIRNAGDNGGIVKELWDRLSKVDGCEITDQHAWVNCQVAKHVAVKMVRETGATVLLHSTVDGAEVAGSKLEGIYIANKVGRQLVRAGIVVDSTGDGDVAAWAGAPYEKGRKGDGRLQAVTLNFVIGGVDEERHPSQGRHRAGYPKGIRWFGVSTTPGVDASDPESLSEGEIDCLEHAFRTWRFLRKNVPGYEKSVLLDVASYLGVRETRRIRGEATLDEADVLKARKYPDGICRASFYMDLHDGQDKTKPSFDEYRARRAPPKGDFYEIPYGCLVPLKLDNLLTSGRCISSTRPANGSMRLQLTCMNIGQAAGTAAALCVKRNTTPRNIDGADLRKILVKQGMDL